MALLEKGAVRFAESLDDLGRFGDESTSGPRRDQEPRRAAAIATAAALWKYLVLPNPLPITASERIPAVSLQGETPH
jgi:hypothetical protein